jgi:hypothetical protein
MPGLILGATGEFLASRLKKNYTGKLHVIPPYSKLVLLDVGNRWQRYAECSNQVVCL